jgi:hypothetical protein
MRTAWLGMAAVVFLLGASACGDDDDDNGSGGKGGTAATGGGGASGAGGGGTGGSAGSASGGTSGAAGASGAAGSGGSAGGGAGMAGASGAGGVAGGAGSGGNNAQAFCQSYETHCGFNDNDHFENMNDCVNSYNSFDADKRACVETHLGFVTSNTSEHCVHAAGTCPP